LYCLIIGSQEPFWLRLVRVGCSACEQGRRSSAGIRECCRLFVSLSSHPSGSDAPAIDRRPAVGHFVGDDPGTEDRSLQIQPLLTLRTLGAWPISSCVCQEFCYDCLLVETPLRCHKLFPEECLWAFGLSSGRIAVGSVSATEIRGQD